MSPLKIIITFFSFIALLLMSRVSIASANEGRFLMQNQLGRDFRCLAFSVEVVLSEYQVLISCRGLIYPPQPPDLDSYILWADGGNITTPTKIANLQFGKASGKLKTRFTRLFVTLEKGSPNAPTGPIAMQGNIQPFNFDSADGNGNSQPTPTATTIPSPTPSSDLTPTPTTEISEATDSATVRTPFWRSTFGKIIIIVTSGFLIFIVIVIIYSRRD